MVGLRRRFEAGPTPLNLSACGWCQGPCWWVEEVFYGRRQVVAHLTEFDARALALWLTGIDTVRPQEGGS